MNKQCVIHDELQQGSDAWFEARKGKCSSSEVSKGLLAAKKGHETYKIQKEAELFLEVIEPGGTSYMMERGKELEPIARDLFQQEWLQKVIEVGGVSRDDLNAFWSPDGLIKLNTRSPHQLYHGVEIKCRNAVNHYRVIKEGIDQPTYEQCQFAMAITDMEMMYFVAFNPDFVDGKKLYVEEIHRDPELAESMCELLLQVKNEIGA